MSTFERLVFALLSSVGLSVLFLLGGSVDFAFVWRHYGSEGFFWIAAVHFFVVALALGIVETLADGLKLNFEKGKP